MTVRDAAASDLPAIRALQSLLPEPAAELFADGLPPGITLVAVPAAAGVTPGTTATPVGYVHAYDTGYVPEIAVAPEHRGRGHGRTLLASVLVELRARDADTAELEVAAANDRARSLYESLGFETTERRRGRYASGDGLLMTVRLDDD